MHNSFGRHFSITSFGESHGVGIGIVIDGCPSGLDIKIDEIQKELDRRRPGQSGISTSRNEQDRVEIMSGILNGKSTGAPICMFIRNTNVDSTKYAQFRTKPRPSHADYPALMKYGKCMRQPESSFGQTDLLSIPRQSPTEAPPLRRSV